MPAPAWCPGRLYAGPDGSIQDQGKAPYRLVRIFAGHQARVLQNLRLETILGAHRQRSTGRHAGHHRPTRGAEDRKADLYCRCRRLLRPAQPMSLASLPMYNLPETAGATAALWRGLARHFRRAGIPDVPDALAAQPKVPDHWLSPDLLFSQTCGYPLTHALAGGVQLLATPCYDAPGCDGPSYCSILVVAAGSQATSPADLQGKRAAFNTPDFPSGIHSLRAV